jgi:hypothetical protein
MYDPANAAHVRVVDGVAEGNALPDVRDLADVLAAAKQCGFEVVDCTDAALGAAIPWHAAMKTARIGSYVTHVITSVLEFIGWAPAGTAAVHKMLMCVHSPPELAAACLLACAACAHTHALTGCVSASPATATLRWTWRRLAAWVCSRPCSCACSRSPRRKRTHASEEAERRPGALPRVGNYGRRWLRAAPRTPVCATLSQLHSSVTRVHCTTKESVVSSSARAGAGTRRRGRRRSLARCGSSAWAAAAPGQWRDPSRARVP